MSNAELKPKKQHRNKKKKKKTTVKLEKETAVKKEAGTLKKLMNFIKSLGSSTNNQTSRAGFPANRSYIDRGASIRVPHSFVKDDAYKGYLEDRRPNSQGCPYQIVSRVLKTVAEVEADYK